MDRPSNMSIAESRAPVVARPRAPDGRPVRVEAVALATLAVLASIAALAYTRAVLLPVFVAVLMHIMLSPVVRRMRRAGIPSPLGAAIVLSLIVGLGGYAAYRIYEPAMEWTRELPRSLRDAESKLTGIRQSVADVSKATEEVQNMTKVETPGDDNVVRIETPSATEALLTDAWEFAGSLLLAVVLLYFLLARQGAFLRKVVNLVPRMSHKKRGVLVFRRIERQLSRYLMTLVSINVCLGVIVGTFSYLVGMPNPLLWGVMAATLNFVPYLGSTVGVAVMLFAGLLTFESTAQAIVPAAFYAAVTATEGTFVTALVLGYQLRLSPTAIFTWLLLWGWMWGFPGALIAVPLLAGIKITCDSIPTLAPLERLLAR